MKQLIKTRIKFFLSEKDKKTLVGYVTKNERNAYRGCREQDPVKKKVVIPDAVIAKGMVANALYDCRLKPMVNDAGFIAVEAELCQFPAIIDTTIVAERFKVEVSFGNTTIVFDPQYGKSDKVRTVEGVLSVLKGRNDIKDKMGVIDAFLKSANIVDAMYREYKQQKL